MYYKIKNFLPVGFTQFLNTYYSFMYIYFCFFLQYKHLRCKKMKRKLTIIKK